MFSDRKRFWVIFDTSTRREYYQDVHNLIALPAGATVRYQYRDQYLSDAALNAVGDTASAPLMVLLVYGQWEKYVKGDRSKLSPPASEMIWIPTRLAEMHLIPAPEGANFFFDFKVMGYPNVNKDTLKKILDPLVAAGEVPFQKWVSLSNNLSALEDLRQGKDSDNWQSIVDQLGSPPIQFAGDSFFRMEGPLRSTPARLISPIYVEDKQASGGAVEVRKVNALYDVFENEKLYLDVISASPPPSAARDDVLVRNLEIQLEKDGPIANEGLKTLDLRQYNRERIIFRAKRYEELDERLAVITLSAGIRADQWPMGATIVQNYRIRKRPAKVIAALVTGSVAAVLLLVTLKFWDEDPVISIAVGFIGILLVVITVLLLTGKLAFKL
jgi:hypothetical protein